MYPLPRRWAGESGHGGFAEVAAVGGLPFVVGLDQDGAPASPSSASGLGTHRPRRYGA